LKNRNTSLWQEISPNTKQANKSKRQVHFMNLFSAKQVPPKALLTGPPVDVKKTMSVTSSSFHRHDHSLQGGWLGRTRKNRLVVKASSAGKIRPDLAAARLKLSKSDQKCSTEETTDESEMMTSLAGSLVSPLQEYEFRLVNSGSVTASSGVWAGAVKFDPTAAAEWSSFDAIFNEYKVVGAKITMLPYFNSSGSTELGTSGPYIILNVNMGAFGTNPTSVANAMEASNSKVVYLSPGGPHSQYVMTTRVTDLQFQIIGAGGTPYAGAYGQFGIYGSDFYSSSNIISYVFELFVVMRARS